uniref:Daxx histone-binding domain-containing protein n=1 Tax=Capitella teleta TaxID=283909 RepID=X1Z3N2_CAPTE
MERKELSIDELADEDTSYLLIDRFKKRFVKVWNKLCEVKGRESTTGRATERKFFYAGSKYPEIDKRIQRFINRKKEFPDYHDIHRIVSACNEKFDLHLNKSYIAQIAKETFVDVGQRLQERRQEDFAENFGCQLTDELKSSKDPALNDAELSRRLASNKKLGNSKMEEVGLWCVFSFRVIAFFR